MSIRLLDEIDKDDGVIIFYGYKVCFWKAKHLEIQPPSETHTHCIKLRKQKVKRSMKVPVVSNTLADIPLEEALAHPYLERLHDNDDEPICMLREAKAALLLRADAAASVKTTSNEILASVEDYDRAIMFRLCILFVYAKWIISIFLAL
ncbi:probable WRKY transcription factor 21 [Tanacetum coccineum]